MPQPNKITSWSFSRYGLYTLCPAKTKYKHIDRLPEPGSEALDHGNAVHKSLENYLKSAMPRPVKEHNPKVFGELLKNLRMKRKRDPHSVQLEETWAFRSDWSETVWNDWNGCWLRIKVDCADIDGDADNIEVRIYDWKTGKFRESSKADYELQLELYALGALLKFRDAKQVSVVPSLVYIDEGVQHSTGVYTLADLPRLQKEWAARAKPLLSDTTFAPRPNNLCRWCAYRKDAGGPCKF